MDCKLLILLFISLLSSCSSTKIKNNIDNSKAFALCCCLEGKGFIHSDTTKIERSKGVFTFRALNYGQFFSELEDFTKIESNKDKYKSFGGHEVILKRAACIDFYKSKELEDFIKKLEKKKFER